MPLDDLAVEGVDGVKAVAFCKAMEFSALTGRVAAKTGVDPAEIPAGEARDRRMAAGRRRAPAHGPDMGVSERPVPVPSSSKQGRLALEPEPSPAPRTNGGAPSGRETISTLGQPAGAGRDAPKSGRRRRRSTSRNITAFESSKTLSAGWTRRASAASSRSRSQTIGASPMQAEISGIALALEPGFAGYIPLGHRAGDGDIFGGGLEKDQIPLDAALEALQPALEDPAVLKIGQNIKDDWLVLARHGIEMAPVDDVMLMSYALDAGALKHGHGLGELASDLLGHERIEFKAVAGTGKDKVTFDRVPIDKATGYASEDADLALRLWSVLKARLPAERVTRVYERLERPLVPVLASMERRGIKVDRQILSRLSGSFAQKAAAAEAEIYELAGQEFNIGSTKQLGDILYGKMGLAGGKKTKTGQWSTDVKVLEDLALEGVPIARRIVDWRQLTKLKSTYTDALPGYIHPETGRVHTDYALASTSTGRLSSSEPNLQNIPIRTEEGRAIRRAFIADDGHKLVSADYSQIELRVLAHMADIPQLVKAFEDGLDIHAMTASEMFGVPVEGHGPERAAPRQGDQFRHHLRHLRLRARGAARHPARRGGRLHQPLFRALSRHPRLHGQDQGVLPRAPLRRDAVRPARALSGDPLVTAVAPRLSGARRDQRADPGLRRRHHPPRDDPHGRGAGGGGAQREECCCRCTTSWCSKCRTRRSTTRSR